MDFGLFNQFNIREGADYHATLKEWLDLAVESEKSGMDSFWFGETHFRPNRSMLSSPLIGARAVASPLALAKEKGDVHSPILVTVLKMDLV